MIKVFERDKVKYLHSESLCYAQKDRVDFAISKGLLVFDKDLDDYMFTLKAVTQYRNFFQWLQGNYDKLFTRGGEYKESIPDNKKSIDEIFDF